MPLWAPRLLGKFPDLEAPKIIAVAGPGRSGPWTSEPAQKKRKAPSKGGESSGRPRSWRTPTCPSTSPEKLVAVEGRERRRGWPSPWPAADRSFGHLTARSWVGPTSSQSGERGPPAPGSLSRTCTLHSAFPRPPGSRAVADVDARLVGGRVWPATGGDSPLSLLSQARGPASGVGTLRAWLGADCRRHRTRR